MNPHDERWEKSLEQVRAFFRQHQRQPLTRTTLGQWLGTQRSLYRRGEMRADRAARLAAEDWWSPGRKRSVIVAADLLQPDYSGPSPVALDAEFMQATAPTRLRETWSPNESGIPACIWCTLPATYCVIASPCDSRKLFEIHTACGCHRPICG